MPAHEQNGIRAEGYIVFSRPMLDALRAVGVGLEDILEQASKQGGRESAGEARLASDPTAAPGTRALDPVTIFAAVATISVLTPAVVRIVEAVLRRKTVIRERVLAPAVDAKGNPLLRPDGQPIMAWWESEQQGTISPETKLEFRVRAFGIEISLAG